MKDVGDREGGGRLKPPGEAASEEWTPCPTCGTHTKRKNLKHHLKKHEKKRAKMKEGEKRAEVRDLVGSQARVTRRSLTSRTTIFPQGLRP